MAPFKKEEILTKTKKYCICGVPISAISENEIIKFFQDCCTANEKIIVNTPNLNFLRVAKRDLEFRKALLNSDLLVPDGMPIIWIARLLKIPITKRLAGSSLIDKLVSKLSDFSFKIFYFGGAPGISRRAHRVTNAIRGKSKSVGYIDPGYGEIASLSKDEYFQQINASSTNLLLVSLPAIKGVKWIEKNKEYINSNITISSGATINFIAGNVKRAPRVFQNLGLEWLWRLALEPRLITRYLFDGIWFSYVLVTRILPLSLLQQTCQLIFKFSKNKRIAFEKFDTFSKITLSAKCDGLSIEELYQYLDSFKAPTSLKIDASNVLFLDSRFIGELLSIKSNYSKTNLNFEILDPSLNFKLFLWLFFANDELL